MNTARVHDVALGIAANFICFNVAPYVIGCVIQLIPRYYVRPVRSVTRIMKGLSTKRYPKVNYLVHKVHKGLPADNTMRQLNSANSPTSYFFNSHFINLSAPEKSVLSIRLISPMRAILLCLVHFVLDLNSLKY
jgi:hypothetical protein